jgi:transcriptional regulator with XRE-family HTH domain
MARPPKPIDPDQSALHWLGHELRRWRTQRGLSQKTLGSQIGFSRVYISLVETAQERPAQPFVERCDHALETGGRLLAIYQHVTAEQAGAHPNVSALRAQAQDQHGALEETDDTPVRAVTAGMPWAGGSDGVPVLDAFGGTTTAVPPGPGASIPPMVAIADVGVIRDTLRALTASDRQFGGAHARQYATDYLGNLVLPRLRAHGDERVLHELFAVSTEFALRVASMHLDAGNARMSRKLLGAAGSLAHETDDLTLAAWVLARRGEQEIHQRNTDRALAYTGGAAAMARHAAPGAQAFILTKHALALSMTGERKETQRVLGEVWDAYDKLGSAAEPEWMRVYGWGHLRHEEGRCYYTLGMGEEAARAAEESMQVRSRDRFARPRAFSLGVQAIGYAQAKDIDKACAVGQELVAVSGQLASDRVRIRLVEVFHALRPYRSVAAVQDLYEAARPVLRGTTV